MFSPWRCWLSTRLQLLACPQILKGTANFPDFFCWHLADYDLSIALWLPCCLPSFNTSDFADCPLFFDNAAMLPTVPHLLLSLLFSMAQNWPHKLFFNLWFSLLGIDTFSLQLLMYWGPLLQTTSTTELIVSMPAQTFWLSLPMALTILLMLLMMSCRLLLQFIHLPLNSMCLCLLTLPIFIFSLAVPVIEHLCDPWHTCGTERLS